MDLDGKGERPETLAAKAGTDGKTALSANPLRHACSRPETDWSNAERASERARLGPWPRGRPLAFMRLTRRTGLYIMAPMRRAVIIVAISLFLLVLFAAPFWHTHIGRTDHDPAHLSQEQAVAFHHAHLPDGRGTSPRNGDRHADMDHSSRETISFVLLADLSPTTFRDAGIFIADTPIPLLSPLVPIEHLSAAMAVPIHDPPWRGLSGLRAPPISPSL